MYSLYNVRSVLVFDITTLLTLFLAASVAVVVVIKLAICSSVEEVILIIFQNWKRQK